MTYYHYYFEPKQGAYIIKVYDENKSGTIQHAHGYPENETVFIYNRRLLTNRKQLTKSLRDAVNGANGGGRFATPVLYNGVNINTIVNDIFVSVDACGRFFRETLFDDTVLKQYECIFE